MPAVCAPCTRTLQRLDDCSCMQKVVPKDVQEVPHAFEGVGHIAHLNLRDELLPYKHIIGQVRNCLPCLYSANPHSDSGATSTVNAANSLSVAMKYVLQVILDKNPAIKTVVNKVKLIHEGCALAVRARSACVGLDVL